MWPSLSWGMTLSEARPFRIRVEYTHSVLDVDEKTKVFVYSLGTGRYVDGWNPPFLGLDIGGKPHVDVIFSVKFPEDYTLLSYHPDGFLMIQGNILYFAKGSYEPVEDFVLVFREGAFMRGDANDDGDLNIADPIYLLYALFGDAPFAIPPDPECGMRASPALGECSSDAYCVRVPAACCACENGGESIAMHRAGTGFWDELRRRRCEAADCPPIDRCGDEEPRCIGGLCELVGPGE